MKSNQTRLSLVCAHVGVLVLSPIAASALEVDNLTVTNEADVANLTVTGHADVMGTAEVGSFRINTNNDTALHQRHAWRRFSWGGNDTPDHTEWKKVARLNAHGTAWAGIAFEGRIFNHRTNHGAYGGVYIPFSGAVRGFTSPNNALNNTAIISQGLAETVNGEVYPLVQLVRLNPHEFELQVRTSGNHRWTEVEWRITGDYNGAQEIEYYDTGPLVAGSTGIGDPIIPTYDHFSSAGTLWAGKIGVNTTAPAAALDVVGDIKLSGDIKLTGNIVGATGTPLLRSSTSGAILGGSALTAQTTISNTGEVGVGTTPVVGAGKIQLPVGTTSANGILFGSDTNLYRQQSSTLHTDSLLSTGKGLIADATFIWSGTAPYQPNGVSQQVTYIDFGDTRFWGWMEVTLSSSYSYQQATGKLTKRFEIGRNPAGPHVGVSEVVTAHGAIATQWKIGDPQVFEGRLRIPVYHLVATGNPLYVQIQGMRVPGGSIPTATFLSGITLTAPTTLENTETRDYPYTLSERTGFGGPATAGRIQLAEATTPAGGIYWGGDTNLYRGAANVLKTDDSLAVMDKLGVGTAAPAAKLDVQGDAKISGSLTVGGAAVLTAAGGSSANLTLSAAKLTGTTTLGGDTANRQVFVSETGNVGVGASPDASYKLNVAGNIKATSLTHTTLSNNLFLSGQSANFGNIFFGFHSNQLANYIQRGGEMTVAYSDGVSHSSGTISDLVTQGSYEKEHVLAVSEAGGSVTYTLTGVSLGNFSSGWWRPYLGSRMSLSGLSGVLVKYRQSDNASWVVAVNDTAPILHNSSAWASPVMTTVPAPYVITGVSFTLSFDGTSSPIRLRELGLFHPNQDFGRYTLAGLNTANTFYKNQKISGNLEVTGSAQIGGNLTLSAGVTLPDGSTLTTARTNTLYSSNGSAVATVDTSGKVNFTNGFTVGAGTPAATITPNSAAFLGQALTNLGFRENVSAATPVDQVALNGNISVADVFHSGTFLYIVGTYSGSASIGGVGIPQIAGSPSGFVAQISESGIVEWTQALLASGPGAGARFRAVSEDAAGNVFVVGSLSGTAIDHNIGPIQSVGDDENGLIACYNQAGVAQWMQRVGGSGPISFGAVAVSSVGDVFVAGQFSGTTTGLIENVVSNGVLTDAILIKYNDSGAEQWTRRVGGTGYDTFKSLVVDGSRSVVAAGYFSLTTTGLSGSVANLVANGTQDAMVVKYDAAGVNQWARRAGGSLSDEFSALALDSGNNIVAVGSFSGTATGLVSSLSSSGASDAMIVKYTPAGTNLWANRVGGVGSDAFHAVVLDANGSSVAAGTFRGMATGGLPANLISANPSTNDGMLIQYSGDGVALWAGKVGGQEYDSVSRVTLSGGRFWMSGGIGTGEAVPFGNTRLAGGFLAGWNNLPVTTTAVGTAAPLAWGGSAAAANAVALGSSAFASGEYSTAFGSSSSTATNAFSAGSSRAFGMSASALGRSLANNDNATAMGASSANGISSVAIGSAYADGDYATAMGFSNATGFSSFAAGYDVSASAPNSVAVGYLAHAYGTGSVVIGSRNSALSHSSIAVGTLGVLQGDSQQWIPTDDLLVVGNGNQETWTRSNAFVVHKNGNTRAAGTVEAKGGFRAPPMGDIDMGDFTAGPTPTGQALDGSNPADLNAGLRYSNE